MLGVQLLSLTLLESSLLILIFFILPRLLVLPEFSDVIRLFWLGRGCDLSLDLLLRSLGQTWGSIVFGEEVRGVLGQFRYSDQTCKVSKVRALVVKLDKAVMLGIITAAEGFEGIIVSGRYTKSEQVSPLCSVYCLLVCIARSMLVINL